MAAALGAVTGIGGGLILRPSLSLMGADLGLATFTSAAAVFTMAVVSITTRRVWKTGIGMTRLATLAGGSIVGAFGGAFLLRFLSPLIVGLALLVTMIAMGALLLLKSRLKPRLIDSHLASAGVGAGTGLLSGLFGIGGGPFQMLALMLLFGSKPKDAVVQSLFIAMLASASALVQYVLAGIADASLLAFVLPGSVAGGLAGYALAKHLSDRVVVVMLFVVILG
ncbi:MAG: sulfite exporter TauE/SafE family protein, partial [Coriobacteriia bacterium]|nr:sulfite exporter TauE/SafE family protein [Coriobacteriia bacterium]MCL2537529.1 sulfite exporter TauE/SafE family protein [Coriobacteriia bacterium]